MSRAKAVERTLATLRFFWNAPQGAMRDATGHRGFFYHFLDVKTGRRAWRSELSTIDTTILVAGALTAGAYFDRTTGDEREVRWLADSLYRRCGGPARGEVQRWLAGITVNTAAPAPWVTVGSSAVWKLAVW